MAIRLVLAPYDSGHREWRMGMGPTHLLRHGIASRVRALGYTVGAEFAEVVDHPTTEIASSFALWRAVASRVRAAVAAGELPVMLSGNCGATLGALAANGGDCAVVWLDAHGDFNTPTTSESGFLDGMALATIVGRCWQTLASTVRGFRPVAERDVVHVAGREFDPEEETQLEESGITIVRASAAGGDAGRANIAAALDAVRERRQRAHLHVDLDALDPRRVGRANGFTPEGGLTTEELLAVTRLVRERFELASVTISAYDPELDLRGGVFDAACRLLEAVAR